MTYVLKYGWLSWEEGAYVISGMLSIGLSLTMQQILAPLRNAQLYMSTSHSSKPSGGLTTSDGVFAVATTLLVRILSMWRCPESSLSSFQYARMFSVLTLAIACVRPCTLSLPQILKTCF